MHETTDQIRRYARSSRALRTREPSRIEVWAWTPVVVLRVGLVALYAINVYVAIMALIAGVPVFSRTTPDGWTVAWAISLMAASAIAAVCVSTDDPTHTGRKGWLWTEMFAAGGVWALAGSYSAALHLVGFASGDVNRQTIAAVSVALFVLPFVRFLWLTTQLGRKPASEAAER